MAHAPRSTLRRVGPPQPDDLRAFPRPSVAVDIAVLTVGPPPAGGGRAEPDQTLQVLLLRRPTGPSEGAWGLPGSFVHEGERLTDAVLRTLADKCGITGLAPRQLGVFDDPGRDDRGWVMSVAHVDVVPVGDLSDALSSRDDLHLASVGMTPAGRAKPARKPVPVRLPDGQERLPFDHGQIVDRAVRDLRDRYGAAPDPDRLVREPFTLLELRRAHEAVLGEELQKDTFRRRMLPGLRELDRVAEGTVGRPARLYRRRA